MITEPYYFGYGQVANWGKAMQKAIFAAGCFWGVEETFRKIPGVIKTRVGYIGGDKANPTYREVCTGSTGHAEAVEIEFDLNKTSYQQLLDIFWNCHNPTQQNRQGPDVGSQYRSAIFYLTPEQEKLAYTSKQTLQQLGKFNSLIVTEINPATPFYQAEDYHQSYFAKQGGRSCKRTL